MQGYVLDLWHSLHLVKHWGTLPKESSSQSAVRPPIKTRVSLPNVSWIETDTFAKNSLQRIVTENHRAICSLSPLKKEQENERARVAILMPSGRHRRGMSEPPQRCVPGRFGKRLWFSYHHPTLTNPFMSRLNRGQRKSRRKLNLASKQAQGVQTNRIQLACRLLRHSTDYKD